MSKTTPTPAEVITALDAFQAVAQRYLPDQAIRAIAEAYDGFGPIPAALWDSQVLNFFRAQSAIVWDTVGVVAFAIDTYSTIFDWLSDVADSYPDLDIRRERDVAQLIVGRLLAEAVRGRDAWIEEAAAQ